MADLKAPAFAALEATVRLFHNEQVSCMLTGNVFYIVFFHCYAVVYKTEESFAFSLLISMHEMLTFVLIRDSIKLKGNI